MSNVHGLFSGRNSNNDADSEDDDRDNNRFVGGIDSRGGGSGLAVEPNTGGPPRDSIFNLAEQSSPDDEPPSSRRTITMYRDGFVVDDGPYRRLDDPSNATFLRSLAQGRTPAELIGDSESGNVTVGLVDKRNEEYVEQFRSFSGEGQSLRNASAGATNNNTLDPSTLSEPPVTDTSRPTTSIQVRLPNGQRKVLKVNLDASILVLASHLREAVDGPFRLVAGFPPKPIEDYNSTVEAASLKGAQVKVDKV